MKDFKLLYKTEVIDMKKWKVAGLITVAGACVIAIVWGLHGRTKNNAKLLQLDEQVSDDSVIYVALGDSITYGYSLEHAENERFSARIAAYMKQQGMQVVECNQGVNGQLSGDMWQNIKKGKIDLLDHADYVTFCIGTNDALLPFEFFVMQYEDYIYGYSGAGDDSLLWGKINKKTFIRDFEEADRSAEDNLNRFYNNLSDSIDLIRKDSPDCRIAIMTLYNPYRNMDYEISAGGITVNIGQYAEEKISQANTIIRTVCKEKNIVLADCYEAFASSNDIVLNNQNAENYIDPDDHPTAVGQQLIADVFIEALFTK